MRRRGRIAWMAKVFAVVATLVVTTLGCGWGGSSGGSGQLRDGIDELAKVRGPNGEQATHVQVLGCSDHAEMPMGIATFPFDGSFGERDVEASNAAWAELSGWYEPRWEHRGWTRKAPGGEVTKVFDGQRLRASVDAVTPTQYSVIVVRDGAGLCS